MLVVAAFKFSHPVLFFVEVKADNSFLHVSTQRQAPAGPIGTVVELRGGEPSGAVYQKSKRDRANAKPTLDQLCVPKIFRNLTYSPWHERLHSTSEQKFGLLRLRANKRHKWIVAPSAKDRLSSWCNNGLAGRLCRALPGTELELEQGQICSIHARTGERTRSAP
jgi:hypothetical protein